MADLHHGSRVQAVEGLANHGERVEVAAIRVRDEAVGDAVLGITVGDGSIGEGVDLAVARILAVQVHNKLRSVEAGSEPRDVDGGRRGHNTVVCGRVALGQHEALPAALGAATPV